MKKFLLSLFLIQTLLFSAQEHPESVGGMEQLLLDHKAKEAAHEPDYYWPYPSCSKRRGEQVDKKERYFLTWCNCISNDVRLNFAKRVLENILKKYPEPQTITYLSIGAGELLQDAMVLVELVKRGYGVRYFPLERFIRNEQVEVLENLLKEARVEEDQVFETVKDGERALTEQAQFLAMVDVSKLTYPEAYKRFERAKEYLEEDAVIATLLHTDSEKKFVLSFVDGIGYIKQAKLPPPPAPKAQSPVLKRGKKKKGPKRTL